MDEPLKNCDKGRSQIQKDNILSDFISVKVPPKANLLRQKVDSWLPGTRYSGGLITNGHEETLRDDGNVLKIELW